MKDIHEHRRVQCDDDEVTDTGVDAEHGGTLAAESHAVGALVARARQGEQDAWHELVRRYTPLLSSVARGYRLNDADAADAVQMTWLRCVEHLDRIYAPDLLRAWLLTTCRRQCLRLVRLRSRTVPADPTVSEGVLGRLKDSDRGSDPVETLLRGESRHVLRQSVATLPTRPRQVIDALFTATGRCRRPYKEIAAALELPVGSLGPTRQRALDLLRRDARVAHLHP